MQHFHSHESLKKLLLEYFEEVELRGNENEPQLYAIASRPRKLPRQKIEDAINVEFNMEYPGDYRHDRHGKLVAAIMQAIEKERGFADKS